MDVAQRGRSFTARRSAVAVGDSIINYGAPTWTSTTRDLSDRGWVNWALAYLKGRLRLLGYYGSGGIEVTEIIRIVKDEIITMSPRPGFLFTTAGGTELLAGMQPEYVIERLKQLYTLCNQSGIIVVDATNGPSTAVNTATLRANMYEILTWKKNYVHENDGVILVDSHSQIVDGANANGEPASGMTQDGTHFTSAGAQRVGLAAFNILDSVVPTHDVLISAINDKSSLGEYGNLLTNPTFTGTSGTNSGTGASGSVADSWIHAVTGTITSVASKVARSGDDIGAWQRLTISAAGASATASMFQDISTGITAGDLLYANVEIQTQSAFTEISSVQLDIAFRDGSSDLATAKALSFGDGTVNAVGNIVLQTYPLEVPTGTTNIYFTVKVQVDSGASAGAATLDIGRAQIRKLYSPT